LQRRTRGRLIEKNEALRRIEGGGGEEEEEGGGEQAA
jgi:hypothetical protein